MKGYAYRITGNKNYLKFYREKLEADGYKCTENKYTLRFDKTTFTDIIEADRINDYFRSKGCTVRRVPAEYSRSADYRYQFFKTHRPDDKKGRYRCVYCGRMFKAKDVTVDHLIPVYAAESNRRIQRKIKRLGYKNINDTKNLVPACMSCNKRKSSRMGLWILRGRLGQKKNFWKFVHFTRAVIVVIVVGLILYGFSETETLFGL